MTCCSWCVRRPIAARCRDRDGHHARGGDCGDAQDLADCAAGIDEAEESVLSAVLLSDALDDATLVPRIATSKASVVKLREKVRARARA